MLREVTLSGTADEVAERLADLGPGQGVPGWSSPYRRELEAFMDAAQPAVAA